jgi:hypothetical protein
MLDVDVVFVSLLKNEYDASAIDHAATSTSDV